LDITVAITRRNRTAFVRITPIISRHEGVEMAELGAGGGKGDLDQQHELEVGDTSALGMLMSLCATKMQDQPKLLSSVMEMLASIMRDPVRAIALDFAALHPEQPGADQENTTDFEEMPLESLISARQEINSTNHNINLPKQIVSTSLSLCFQTRY
jgi:DNA cross-link repair 1C protein